MQSRSMIRSVAALLALALAGCSSSSKSDSGSQVSSFKVGVTVSGLHGTGLVLRNNGTDDLVVAADGTHQFATSLPAGRPYAVTVRAQPRAPSQVCTVSDGAGTVASADVTAISVSCTTQSFAVRGFVMGLLGAGLVLRDNGGDDLEIAADGPFAFETPVASGADYAVTVVAAPASQICQVTIGAQGTVGSGDVTGVTVVCSDRAFHVGGSVSGLLGTGLVLWLNGQDLPVAADGPFTFPTAIVAGGAYVVTVQADPQSPAQGCTVAHASGVIGSGDVSDVAVTCSTQSFRVQGTVTGLKGAGLVLRLNGGNDPDYNVTVTGNGAFAFPMAVQSGAAYSVTMASQPLGALCGVQHGSGTVANQSVSDVLVTCYGWGSAQLVETNDAGNASRPSIAFDSTGNGLAVWYQSDGTRDNIWSNRYTPGSGWTTPLLVENGTGPASLPHIGTDSAGNALAVWPQADGTGTYRMMANRYTAAAGWGAEAVIGDVSSGNPSWYQLAVHPSGSAVAVWLLSPDVWGSIYTPGVGWGAAQRLGTGISGAWGGARVAIDGAGNPWVTWQSSGNIYVRRHSIEGGWETEELVATVGNNNGVGYPALSLDASGNGMLVYQDGPVRARRYTPGTGWSATAATINTAGASAVSENPIVVADAAGNFLAVWSEMSNSGSNRQVASNRYTAGQGWGDPTFVVTTASGGFGNVQLAVDSSGNGIAVWSRSGGAHANIGAAAYAAGQGWGPPGLIETDDAGDARYPFVAFDSSGRAMAIWQQSDGTRTNIWSNRFE